ncbi:MAG TPA: hydrogenase maturation nickel metallochaperone HypA [Clostridia bacterium]|nr:hydrogenase maturation nickel metallochaperone HypA [Clostridia bacterium]
MHELGVLAEVVRVVEETARKQNLTEIESLVLQIGELSPMIPYYVEQCYPAASYGTLLEHTRLEIEVLPANGHCRACGRVYSVAENRRVCPACGKAEFELLGGREFTIKQIVAR